MTGRHLTERPHHELLACELKRGSSSTVIRPGRAPPTLSTALTVRATVAESPNTPFSNLPFVTPTPVFVWTCLRRLLTSTLLTTWTLLGLLLADATSDGTQSMTKPGFTRTPTTVTPLSLATESSLAARDSEARGG